MTVAHDPFRPHTAPPQPSAPEPGGARLLEHMSRAELAVLAAERGHPTKRSRAELLRRLTEGD